MSKPKPTKHEDDIRRGLRTAQYNGIIDTQLKFIDELKAEIESLKKPAIIGGYNLSEYIRMANSETLEFDNGDIFADMTLPERIKYIVESHARLKAELTDCKVEADRLKAEVERLTKAIEGSSYYFMSIKLNVENARLRKAGDAMERSLAFEYPDSPKVKDWRTAKEGKQS